jgi:hypothetical protein
MWTVPKAWEGETVFIFGGGPSLRGFDPERLRGRRTIVINRMVLPVDANRRSVDSPLFDRSRLLWPGVPWADVLFFADYSWWKRDEAAILQVWHGSRIVTSNRQGRKDPRLLPLEITGQIGLERRPNGLRSGGNSGHQAMNLAYHFGARRIVLLGFDQKTDDRVTHAHGGYAGSHVSEVMYRDHQRHVFQMVMTPNFERIGRELLKEGVEVLNACPDSAIPWFEKIPLEGIERL